MACISCPFGFTEESDMAQNYGCLPAPYDIIRMRVNHQKTWACHSDLKKPCSGAISYLQEEGLPSQIVDQKLVTIEDDWSPYI